MEPQANAQRARLQRMISESKQDLIAFNTALTVAPAASQGQQTYIVGVLLCACAFSAGFLGGRAF